MTQLKGIDVSYWQRNNYEALINNFGKDFVICRAAFSKNVDAYCDKMYQYAKSRGKKLGFYFFPLTSDGTPEACAEWAYRQVLGYIGEAIPILDWEAYQNTTTHNHNDTGWAHRWLKKFYALSGVKPVIYMSASLEASLDWSKVANDDYGLWIAKYGNNDGTDHGCPTPKHWRTVAMHQYTSRGDGVSLDCDNFFGSTAAWDAYCGKKQNVGTTVPTVSVPQIETKKTNREIAQEVIDDKWGVWDDRFNALYANGYDARVIQDLVNSMLKVANPYQNYTVVKGDNLSKIAARYKTTYQKIAADNKIKNVNLIYPGMVLKIY